MFKFPSLTLIIFGAKIRDRIVEKLLITQKSFWNYQEKLKKFV